MDTCDMRGPPMTALVETDLEFAHRWAASRNRMPLEAIRNATWFWSYVSDGCDERCESDLPEVLYVTIRNANKSSFFPSEEAAWEGLASALAELRKAVDVL